MKTIIKALLCFGILAAPAAAIKPITPSFTVTDVVADENSGKAVFTIKKSSTNNNAFPSVVSITTVDGTAKSGTDYTKQVDIDVEFSATEMSKTVTVPLINDSTPEVKETFSIKLNPTYNSRLADGTGVATITDTDVAPPPPPPPPVVCPDGTTVPAGQTCPVTPPPPPPPPTGESTVFPIKHVPSNFDVTRTLSTSGNIPSSGAPDVVGAFRFICGAGQLSYDDPILYPGQPGKSHLHQFYGNVKADAHSTYSSLRSKGGSTCNYVGNPNVNWLSANPDVYADDAVAANRSAYWMPAMLDGKGNVVRPDVVSIYYKQRPAKDPLVSDPTNPKYQGKAVKLPDGLRFIFGWDPTGINKELTGSRYFNCTGPTAKPGHYTTLTTALANCPAGNQVGAIISAPDCWDGKNLDSSDHRSHVAYISYGSWGYARCPATHPFVIPTFTMAAWYTVAAGDNTALWTLSSDHMAPGQPAGYTFHADFFMAWDDTVHNLWYSNCVDKLLNCSGGQLGNGQELRGAMQPYYWDPAAGINRPMWKHPQRLVPIP